MFSELKKSVSQKSIGVKNVRKANMNNLLPWWCQISNKKSHRHMPQLSTDS